MSDLSSNSMTREQMIRLARSNCVRQIEQPGQRKNLNQVPSEEIEGAVSRGSLRIRLFVTGILFLSAFAAKQYKLSYHQYDQKYIQNVIESDKQFQDLQKDAAKLLEGKNFSFLHRLNLKNLI